MNCETFNKPWDWLQLTGGWALVILSWLAIAVAVAIVALFIIGVIRYAIKGGK